MLLRHPLNAVSLALISSFCTAAMADGLPNVHSKERIGTVQQVYDGALMPDVQANTFRNIDRLFSTRTIHKGKTVYPLPKSDVQLKNFSFASNGKNYDLYDYVSINRVSGLLVIKNGKIAFEDYELGNSDQTRWMSMSVVKSITATLVGIAIQDGFIKSIDDPVTRYLPELKGSAYDGVSVRNLLQMASGVQWNETYTDPASDRRKMLEVQNAQTPGAVLKLMAQLPRAAAPGTRWNYSTGETHVAGALVRAAVGKPVAQYLSERVWSKFGMESDATWWLESPNGLEVGGSGLSATLRDYGRFGLFLMGGGKVGNEQLLPAGWVADAGSPKMVDGKPVDYGYMLWPIPKSQGTPNEGAFEARGIFGQHVYMNPRENTVIVVWGALPKPTGKNTINDNDFFAAAVQALR
ncbi:beta-lactamase family protein [Comamonas terrigena]|uniref:serine hydrolase domain-containing protein n=1 Tax=Comamonas terrigena TaxID=32013 RepID=UPI00244AA1D0|nr:serine hydrolase [Comamonas terrigena]MDH1293636.1 beta-lactamase family protein [Comamonas terrigena]